MASPETLGLTTKEALSRLTADIDDVLRKHCCKSRSRWRSLRISLRDSVVWNYRSIGFTVFLLILLLIAIIFERRALDIAMFFTMLGLSILNTLLVSKIRWKRWILWKQKAEEIRHVVDQLSQQDGVWRVDDVFPSLYQPTTSSVHLQWTFRDGRLVNLPACLLVRGDVVLLRPGQEIFAECRPEGEGDERFSPGQVYRPQVDAGSAPAASQHQLPAQHNVQLPRTFGVTKTPFVDSLELMLVCAAEEKSSPWRSIPELCLLQGMRLVYAGTSLLLLIAIVEGVALRLGRPETAGSLAEVFLRPVYVAYCFHPLLFPTIWLLVRAWLASQFRLFSDSSCMTAIRSRTSLSAPCSGDQATTLEESGTVEGGDVRTRLISPPLPPNASVRRQATEMWRLLAAWDAEASELVFSLGTLTALCCVDKKGVLSLPQPTIDKVFFLRRRHHRYSSLITSCPTSGSLRRGRRRSEVSMNSAARREESNYSTIGSQNSGRIVGNMRGRSVDVSHPTTAITQSVDFHAHVLELGNVPHLPYEQAFEDRHWQRYLNSLKPIGLNILLNNCNPEMFPRYTTFADYLTLLADRSPVGREVAAINHRCMCGLARQIGFLKSATQPFQLATSLAAFRHSGNLAGAEGEERSFQSSLQERLFRALSSSHHRTPMAHVLSAVTSQARVGCFQLMSQGSADLLLELCIDYWDGNDLSPLREAEKRRALDFYHRHIHSAYCTAFAYSPLFESIAEPMSDVVLELPEQSVSRAAVDMGPRILLPSRNHLPGVQTVGEISTSTAKTSKTEETNTNTIGGGRIFRTETISNTRERSAVHVPGMSRTMSAESMMSRLSAESISTSEDCVELLKNQVFLGMATLQYQPLTDVVPLVSQLQEACVRFVHFSQENELRSRVFAEKLGLEAGSFNCHISLAENSGVAAGHTATATDGEGTGTSPSQQRNPQGAQEPGSNISRWDSAPVVMGNVSFFPGNTQDEENGSDERLEIAFAPSTSSESSIDKENVRRGSSSTTTSEGSVLSDGDSLTHHLRQDKSKMPRGIAAIRPHLEDVDNIPLQVSLFTDCTADAVREMLEIMQENGEIVAAVGSTLSLHNTAIFLQADCSVGLQPDTPYVCVSHEYGRRCSNIEESPVDLASRLLALPCSLAGMREMGLRFLVPSMADCRGLVQRVRVALAFYFACGAFLSAIELLAVLLGWPWGPGGTSASDFFPFDASCLMWLQLVTVPVLCLPVLLSPSDPDVMMKKPPTKRDDQWVRKRLKRQLLYGTGRCLPSLIVCLLLAHFSIITACSHSQVQCVVPNTNVTKTNLTMLTGGQMQRSSGQFIFLFAVSYLAVISLSYINEGKQLRRINRRSLIVWSIFSSVHVLLVFVAIVPLNLETFRFVHPAVWAAAVVWIFLLGIINELFNRKESSINLREERRFRFMFNTKLGMYSPV